MLKLILLTLMASLTTFAQVDFLEQATTAVYKDDVPDIYAPVKYGTGMRIVKSNTKSCEVAEELRKQLSGLEGEERQKLIDEINRISKACYIDILVNEDKEVVGLRFENESKNNINPRTAAHGSSRLYQFEYADRSKQDMHLHITENSGLTGKMSHDLLETKIVFVPRRVLPYIDMNHDQVDCVQKLILPTDEYILFDALTKEIIGGVLEEKAMDMEESRHHREFAGLEYTGNGIMIRADRRAGTPEHTYNVSYNVNEKIKKATLSRKGKSCDVSKDLIWENTNNPNITAYFKYKTDQEFLDKVVNPVCGWNLTMEDII
jgi:hypothetical protein